MRSAIPTFEWAYLLTFTFNKGTSQQTNLISLRFDSCLNSVNLRSTLSNYWGIIFVVTGRSASLDIFHSCGFPNTIGRDNTRQKELNPWEINVQIGQLTGDLGDRPASGSPCSQFPEDIIYTGYCLEGNCCDIYA